ncbi:MAG: hypothetical protein ACR2FP_09715 [Nocardioidaceae bacterium]
MSDHPPPGPPSSGPPGWSGQGQPGWSGQGQGPAYPQQHLLPQEVHRGVNRKPLYLVIAAIVAMVVVAGVAFVLLRDDGEDNRAAYCAELRDITNDGDLGSALSGADASMLDRIRKLPATAPTVVADDWTKVIDAMDSAINSQSPDPSQLLTAFGALRAISTDAKQNCGLDLQLL